MRGKKNNHNFKFYILCLLMFFLVFNIQFKNLPPIITSARISCILLFMWGVFKNRMIIKIDNSFSARGFFSVWKLMFVISLYSAVLLIIYGRGYGSTALGYYLNFLIFISLGFYGIVNVFDKIEQITSVFITIMVIQSIIILISVASSSFRNFIDTTFNSQSYFNTTRSAEDMYNLGYAFGIGCMTSTGSIGLSFGQISILYLLKKDFGGKALHLLEYTLITMATTMLSRTGLFISLFILAVLFLSDISPKRFFKILFSFSLVVLFLYLLLFYSSWSELLLMRFSRLEHLIKNGLYESYFKGYLNADTTSIPVFSIDTILGMGILSGITGNGIKVNVDGGYLRSYAAIGVVWSLILYLTLLRITTKVSRKFKGTNEHIVCTAMIILLFFGEIKEPHILRFILCFYFSICYFMEKDRHALNGIIVR